MYHLDLSIIPVVFLDELECIWFYLWIANYFFCLCYFNLYFSKCILIENSINFVSMKPIVIAILFSIWLSPALISQDLKLSKRIDSLILGKSEKPFNGLVVIAKAGKVIFKKTKGQSDVDRKSLIKLTDQFVIGSISKQITAVMVMQLVDKGLLELDAPISKYFKGIRKPWADSVTIHHLLTHTHGIVETNKPLLFTQGTQYKYSQLGYELLSKIMENVSNKNFKTLAMDVFQASKMTATFHPDVQNYTSLVSGYTEDKEGKLVYEKGSLDNFAPAGSFISNANDLVIWNELLHGGKLLTEKSYGLMHTEDKVAVREHPVFGKTNYGYGTTIDRKDSLLQYGQTGLAPGFVSMNFYFPASQISVIVLSNTARSAGDLKKTFFYHAAVLKMVRASDLMKQ